MKNQGKPRVQNIISLNQMIILINNFGENGAILVPSYLAPLMACWHF